jgi:hypothetical protein
MTSRVGDVEDKYGRCDLGFLSQVAIIETSTVF